MEVQYSKIQSAEDEWQRVQKT